MNTALAGVYERMLDHLRNDTTDQVDSILAVPIANFTSAEHLAKELDVFRRVPLAVAMGSELPEPLSFVTRDILGVPVLITRMKNGKVAAFRNMCRHRGGKVEQDESGKKPFFVCGYHGWSYDSAGALRGVPYDDELGGIDKSCNSLIAVQCEEHRGIVWLDFSGNAERTVSAWLDQADERLAESGVENTVVFMEKKLEVSINWKLVMDGAIDVLHPQFLHPNGVGKLIQTNAAVWNDYGRHGQSFSARKRLAEKVKAGDKVEAGWRYITGNLMLFPNASLIPTPDHFEYWNVWPDLTDPGRCHIHIRFLVDPTRLNDTMAERINKSWSILQQAALEEDFPMEETIQANAKAHPVGHFIYGRSEGPCQHLHRQMARELEAAEG
jgi:phenylpropionate dioxygenase-like ring-hydroxylating dioxygenase large terminal subunit